MHTRLPQKNLSGFIWILLLGLFGWINPLFSQNKPGIWTPHLAFSNPIKVEVSSDKVYFATSGGLFYYDQTDHSVGTITKREKLSETRVKTIGYNETAAVLVVVFENGTINLLSDDGSVFPILDLKRKNIVGNKTVNHLYQKGNLCYLSCGFGIVVLDVVKREIKDTYIIGTEGAYVNVNCVTSDDENLYAATSDGMMSAGLSSNLLDFANWHIISDSELPITEYYLTYYNEGTLYAITKMENQDYGYLPYVKTENDIWRRAWWPFYAFSEMRFSENGWVVVASDYEINIYNPATQDRERIGAYSFQESDKICLPKSVAVDQNGVLWVADQNYGGVRINGQETEKIEPLGPVDNSMAHLSYGNGTLWVSHGGIDKAWGNTYQPALLQYYDGKTWKYFDKSNVPALAKMGDIFFSTPVPGESDHVFVSPYGHGLIEFKGGELVNHYTHLNSNLMRVPLSNSDENIIRVGGMAFDQDGNLWMSNSLVDKNLHCLKPDGTWQSFSLPEIANNYDVGKVIATSQDQIWMIIPRGKTNGLYVMSTDGTRKKHLDVISYFSGSDGQNRAVSMNDVYDVVEDLEGTIWAGTSKGVITYSNPAYVFDQEPYYGYQPAVDQNDGIYHPLLETEIVTAIAVNGANQKWLGTSGSGVYLVSADGTQELNHFTTENYPLLSNSITSLAYDGDNGVLYIGTDNGLIAYNTEAKTAKEAFTNVYAYPNPVRPDYTGNIYITGLMYNSNVKIATVSGRLVYETTSLGGQAVWPGTDLAGNRVHTGVYLVFCASEDGTQSEVAKILFIR